MSQYLVFGYKEKNGKERVLREYASYIARFIGDEVFEVTAVINKNNLEYDVKKVDLTKEDLERKINFLEEKIEEYNKYIVEYQQKIAGWERVRLARELTENEEERLENYKSFIEENNDDIQILKSMIGDLEFIARFLEINKDEITIWYKNS